MGLLSRISNSSSTAAATVKTVPAGGGAGLLAKAQISSTRTYSSFQEWAEVNGYSHCGIFSVIHGMMVITHAYGLDCQTIANSVSSKDFWEGTLSSDKAINYSHEDNELYNFMQFFSLDLRSCIKHISFVKIPGGSDFSVLMIFNTDSDKEINLSESAVPLLNFNVSYKLDVIPSVAKKLNYRQYILGIGESVRAAIKSVQLPEENIKKAVSKCIGDEIFYMLKKAFPSPCLISIQTSGKVRLALNNTNLDDLLLQAHINLLLQDLLCNPSSMPSLESLGTPADFDSLMNFLEN